MALPKEPRQKMINIMYLVLTAILALNVSAEVINAFRTVDTSLQNSNANITTSNETLYKSLEKKKTEATSAAQAAIWAPKAEQAKRLSAELMTYIEELKVKLKEGSNLRMVEKDGKMVEDFKLDGLDASTRIFETGGKGKEFEEKLVAYKKAMLDIDPKIRREYEATLPIDVTPPLSQEGHKKDFTASYFHMTPTIAALTMLSKFQNNIKNAESQVVTFCHNQVGQVEVHMDQAAVLVSQSSNYLMPNDKLTIKAGVGAYSSAASPVVSINGSNVSVANGVGQTEITASGSGAHTVIVRVQYYDEHKVLQTKEEKVEYTVGTPGGSAVMLDKMNVFYIGVDNPVTISSGTGWDKTKVSMTGGSISGNTGKFTVKVSGGTTASITVNADGKSSTFPFRVKRIPDPVFKIGSGKVRMPAVEFKNQQYCRADLANFDFDLKFSVVSATVYFGGANFPNVVPATITGNSLAGIASLIQRCGPGSSISFDNIKVQGPDGVRGIDGASFQLY
jgi:gliding motility-associated protein GldM